MRFMVCLLSVVLRFVYAAGRTFWLTRKRLSGSYVALMRGEPVVVAAVGSPNAILTLVHHHVHVGAAGRIRVQRLEVVDAPPADELRVRRVGVDAGEDGSPRRVAVAPGGVGQSATSWTAPSIG